MPIRTNTMSREEYLAELSRDYETPAEIISWQSALMNRRDSYSELIGALEDIASEISELTAGKND